MQGDVILLLRIIRIFPGHSLKTKSPTTCWTICDLALSMTVLSSFTGLLTASQQSGQTPALRPLYVHFPLSATFSLNYVLVFHWKSFPNYYHLKEALSLAMVSKISYANTTNLSISILFIVFFFSLELITINLKYILLDLSGCHGQWSIGRHSFVYVSVGSSKH